MLYREASPHRKVTRFLSSPDSLPECEQTYDDQKQLDLLVRLRIIEQLNQVSNQPRFRSAGHSEDLILDILNWIALCFCPNSSSDDVAVAFATYNGSITLYVSSSGSCPNSQSLETSKVLLQSILKQIFRYHGMIPNTSTRLLLRMIVDKCYLRIQRKISLLGNAEGDPESTAHRFMTLVNSWLFYRPEGETSKGFIHMALTHTGDVSETTEYMIQSFYTIANQADVDTDRMTDDERYSYLTSIISACDLFVNSTFFGDLMNHHTFRLTLKPQDRIFLHTLFRRITQIAAYKTGAAKFAHIGIPYMLEILGPNGRLDFMEDTGTGGITIELVSLPKHTKWFTWPDSPVECLSSLLGCDGSATSMPAHSRETSVASNESGSSSSSLGCHFNPHAYHETSQLDNQLCSELLESDIISDAWVPGNQVESKCHSVIQLVHYLEGMGVDISCSAIGTSKPICWACERYIRNLEYHLEAECRALDSDSDDDSDENLEKMTPKKWYMSQGSGKIKHDWLIPQNAKKDVVIALIEDAQKEMERVVAEVAFDCYL